MAVKKFYSTKAKAGWRFDAKQNKFWSYGFDIRLETGKRKCESGFATKQLAENPTPESGKVPPRKIDYTSGSFGTSELSVVGPATRK